MLPPDKKTSPIRYIGHYLAYYLPRVIICGGGDGAATKYRLVLHEILPTAGEDRAVGNQYVLGDARIRDYNKQLVAHPEREDWPIRS
jgi:hypothetical protein